MAEVRKGKAEGQSKPRTRAAASLAKSKPVSAPLVKPRPKPTAASLLRSKPDAELKRLLLETQDQLCLIHGVLEELCERQEALAAWQMEFSKRLVSLQEAQWRSLEDLAGVDMGRPVEKAFGFRPDSVPSEVDDSSDQLEDAHRMMEEVNSHALPKRAERLRKRRDPFRSGDHNSDPLSDDEGAGEVGLKASRAGASTGSGHLQDSPPDSVFVMPTKVDVH